MTSDGPSTTGPVAFVLLTFAISWGFYAGWVLVPGLDSGTATLLLLGGGLGPFAAALLLTWRRRDVSLRTWLRDRFHLRVPGRYYLFALVLPPVVVVLAAVVHVGVFGGPA